MWEHDHHKINYPEKDNDKNKLKGLRDIVYVVFESLLVDYDFIV